MLNNFQRDLEKGKTAEQLILSLALAAGYNAEDVSDIKECRHKGDIKITLPTGQEIFLEVKNDTRIHDTGKIVCEEECYIKDSDYCFPGNMSGDSDYFIIVSEPAREIYVLDFKILKSIYRKGEYRELKHTQQISYCFLLDLYLAKHYGALLSKISY